MFAHSTMWKRYFVIGNGHSLFFFCSTRDCLYAHVNFVKEKGTFLHVCPRAQRDKIQIKLHTIHVSSKSGCFSFITEIAKCSRKKKNGSWWFIMRLIGRHPQKNMTGYEEGKKIVRNCFSPAGDFLIFICQNGFLTSLVRFYFFFVLYVHKVFRVNFRH